MNSNQLFTYPNIDKILGDSRYRYLSCGYKNVYYNMNNIYIYPTLKTLIAEASISYQENWSLKTETQKLIPHLSTLDALLISLYANFLYLSQTYRLDDFQRNQIYIKSVEIKAGSKPQNELDKIPLNTKFISTEYSGHSLYGFISKFTNIVGTLRVDLEYDHFINHSDTRNKYFASLDNAWQDLQQSYYGGLFKHTTHQLTDIVIDIENKTILSSINIDHANSCGCFDRFNRINSFYSVIDLFVCASQQMQALLYHIDGLDRKSSNNLWMRRILYQNKLQIYNANSFKQTVKLDQSKVLIINKNQWRTADFECNIALPSNPFYLKTNLVHQLPE